MAVFVLEDLQGQVEVVMFPDIYSKFSGFLTEDRIAFVKGKLDRRNEKPGIVAAELIALEETSEKIAAKVRIKLRTGDITKEKIAQIKSICLHHRGKSPIYLSIKTDKGLVLAKTNSHLTVKPDPDFCRKIKHLIGEENLQLTT